MPSDTNPELRDKVDIVSIDEITPYGDNPKDHPEEQVEKIARSIERFGWDQPIVINGDGAIIKGHGRLQAAERLNLRNVPVIRIPEMSEAEARAARIADNRVSESTWDIELLGSEIGLLDEQEELDLDVLGFDNDELEYFDVDVGTDANDPYEEWDESGVSDYENEDQTAEFSVKVNFESKEDLDAFADLVDQKITEKTQSIWYPEQEDETFMDKEVVNAAAASNE